MAAQAVILAIYQPAPSLLPTALSETQREDLATTNAGRHDWIEEEGRPNREATHGSYRRVADYRMSTTDPDATIMPLKGHGLHLGYHTHYVVDGGKKRIILNVLVTPSEVMESQSMLDLLWRTQFRWKLHPHQVTEIRPMEPSTLFKPLRMRISAPICRLQSQANVIRCWE